MPGVGPRQLGGQLDALGLAAGERRRRLAQREVAQADVGQRLEDLADPRHVGEQLERRVDRHVQHVGDRLAVELDGQGLGRVAGAAAGVAGDPDIGQEVHLDPLLPGALAGLAPAAGLVEAEPARRVAADLGLGELGEQLADQVEGPRVGRRGRVRRAAQRRLVDADHLVDLFEPLDRLVGAGGQLGAVQRPRGGLPEDVFHQRALARARDARHGRDDAEREADVDVPAGCAAAPP